MKTLERPAVPFFALLRCPVCVERACQEAPLLILKGGFDWVIGADAKYHWSARDAQAGCCGTRVLYRPAEAA